MVPRDAALVVLSLDNKRRGGCHVLSKHEPNEFLIFDEINIRKSALCEHARVNCAEHRIT